MGKIAVMADIHSNVWALEAVLSDAKNKGARRFVNLGDTLYGPLAPKETWELLQGEEIMTIKGNQDRQIYEAKDGGPEEDNPTMAYVLSELASEAFEWMRALPPTLVLGEGIFLCHGTPDSDLGYLLEDVSGGHAQVRSDGEITGDLVHTPEGLVLCGHTHTPRAVTLGTGQLVVNPGSVGLPAYSDDAPVPHRIENYSHHASYCLIEPSSTGWQVDFVRVPYAYRHAVDAATLRKRDDWAYSLSTGRAR
ncbi:metallophosphoesterase family protein [Desulfoluna spongiiphila]|uniref:Predicted phosphodiesterase n=1 Tax=Desulfoluna spongiiphila TaxID=419481 RepID=A0A1G5HJJ1_9BACT|nr:metallophosphoesterase family protein [Desulfoluna spongiiphila]SCY63946.1 Predicted phosphodiesterase [Desulfoluna spongiiphila]